MFGLNIGYIRTNIPTSHAISQTTNLLLTTITTASNYYVSHSTPSPHHPSSSVTPNPRGASADTPQPLPPRALVFLTSGRTRKGLAGVHAVSGQAVKVSSMTVSMIDNMIRRAMGAKSKRPRAFLPNASLAHFPPESPRMLSPTALPGTPPQLPPRTPSPSSSKSYLVPPPYYYPSPAPSASFQNDKPALPPRRSPSPTPPPIPRIGNKTPPLVAPHPSYSGPARGPIFPNDKPPLPLRQSPSPAPPVIPRTRHDASPSVIPLPHQRLTTKDRVLLSADLILSTLDHSTRELLNTSTESVGTVVRHKYAVYHAIRRRCFTNPNELFFFVCRYGPEAGHNSVLMAGTARNLGLVYVDMAGIGRRALLRRAGVQFVKGRLSGNGASDERQF